MGYDAQLESGELFGGMCGGNFFGERVINAWNSLPVNIVDFSTLSRFRYSISEVDFTSFMKSF